MGRQSVPYRYALVQYLHDPARGEALNVGVLLEDPRDGQVLSVFGDGARVRRLYKSFDDDVFESLAAQVRSLASPHPTQRLIGSPASHEEVHESLLNYMHREFGGRFAVTVPRPIMVKDPEAALGWLKKELVDQPREPAAQRPKAGPSRVHRRLKQALEGADLLGSSKFVEHVQYSGKYLSAVPFDFGYRNGRVTVLRGVWLGSQDPHKLLQQLGAIVLQINDVRQVENSLDPYVVVGFPQTARSEVEQVRGLLGEEHVTTWLADNLEQQVQEFKGKLLARA